MLRLMMQLILVAILILTAKSVEAECQINVTDSKSECFVSSINSDLNTISQIADNARRKLPNDLKGLCSKVMPPPKPIDCSDIYKRGHRQDGPYEIWPQSRVASGPLVVYCDMTGNGGGWTVIQRRGDFNSAKEYFYQDWNSYKKGFGDVTKDFWIGNDNLFALTNQRAYVLQFDLRDWEKNLTFAVYDEFWIDDEFQNYTLHVKGYRGTAGDSFTDHNECKFSTKDRDNDRTDRLSCAVAHKGAWWYFSCHGSNLNGIYYKGKHDSYADGVNWRDFKGFHYSLKDTVMKIRPADFGVNLHMEKPAE